MSIEDHSVAGHTFRYTPNGLRCTIVDYLGRACHAPWVLVRTMRCEDIGVTEGLAHTGKPNRSEYDQVVAARDREEVAIWTATCDAASSGSR